MPDLSSLYNSPSNLVQVSAADTTPDYLEGKLVAGTNVTLTKNNTGADETITIAATGGGSSSTCLQNGTSTVCIDDLNGSITFTLAGNAAGGLLIESNNPYYANVALGPDAMGATTSNIDNYSNVAIGVSALYNNVGFRNVAIGQDASLSNTTGVDNVAIGSYSLNALTTGSLNIALGNSALYSATTVSRSIAIGNSALSNHITGNDVIAIGTEALFNDISSNDCIAIGEIALYENTTGSRNIAIGQAALLSNTTGTYNLALGIDALINNTIGGANIGVGWRALNTCDNGYYNIGIGQEALSSLTSGEGNIGIGLNCAGLSDQVLGFTGNYNCVIGHNSLSYVQSGSYNSVFGAFAGDSVLTGNNNTILGHEAEASSSGVSNEVTLGNSSITSLRCAVTSITSLSDARDKTNIQTLPLGLDFISTLNPVKFTWNTRDGAKVGQEAAGFIAQDLQVAQQGNEYLNLVLDNNPDKLEATPGNLIPVMVKAIQDLEARLVQAETEIALLKSQAA
jgi:hypothetical protein